MKKLSTYFALPWRYKKQKKEYDVQEHNNHSFFWYRPNGFEKAIRNFFGVLESIPAYIRNFFFFLKYPFWQPRNVWTGKKYWRFSEYEAIPEGWRKAFGKQLSKDLKAVLKEEKQLKTFYFSQVKQKWGYLRMYPCFTTEKIYKILDYYEHLSIGYCEFCGKPARYYKNYGYHVYLCGDCMEKELKSDRPDYKKNELIKIKKQFRLKKNNIPVSYSNKQNNGTDKEDNLYKVDYSKLWGLKKTNENKEKRKEDK